MTIRNTTPATTTAARSAADLREKFFPRTKPIAHVNPREFAERKRIEEERKREERLRLEIERQRQRLEGIPPMPRGAKLTVLRVLDECSLTYKEAFRRHARGKESDCRKEIFRALMEEGYSSPQIGGWFGYDHTTVLYAAGRVTRRYEPKRTQA